MKIESKYSIKDKVYIIVNRYESKWIPCETCNSAGIILVKEKEFRCPECYGKGGENKYLPAEWRVGITSDVDWNGRKKYADIIYGNIGQIKVEVNRKDIKIQYMLKETGVGSGSVWNEEDLFPTFEEAQAECDKRNSIINIK